MLGGDEQDRVEFEAFFTHILTHELCHGLGPHQITVNGKPTTPREQLKELYSAIEEAKADVTGLFALQYMLDHAQAMGLADVLKPHRSSEKQLYATYLASSFRTLALWSERCARKRHGHAGELPDGQRRVRDASR